jgi:hypothetical protein
MRSDPSAVLGILVLLIVVTIVAKVSSAVSSKRRKKVEEARQRAIYAKYGQTEMAERILNGTLWKGETAEQLLDSLGPAAATESKLLKTKRKEVRKYAPIGRRRYAIKITLENDVVVGWDVKG